MTSELWDLMVAGAVDAQTSLDESTYDALVASGMPEIEPGSRAFIYGQVLGETVRLVAVRDAVGLHYDF